MCCNACGFSHYTQFVILTSAFRDEGSQPPRLGTILGVHCHRTEAALSWRFSSIILF
jgi:hypothetical protein